MGDEQACGERRVIRQGQHFIMGELHRIQWEE
jgi:hypothetical protein